MDAIAPSESLVEVLRAISRANFEYTATKALAHAAGWGIDDDDPDQRFVTFYTFLSPEPTVRRRITVLLDDPKHLTCAFIPLYYFDDCDDSREPFDHAFRLLHDQLIALLGSATKSGDYRYPHRSEWPYSYAGWVLPDATLTLVQDEFDIQFGMDVTLWVHPAGSDVLAPSRYS